MLIKNLVLIGSVAFAAAKEVTGVFTNFESLVFQNAGNYSITSPDKPSWIATLHWVIDGSKEKAGDTFTLNMPCVFKFTTPAGVNSVDLKVNNDVYATCKFSPGEIVVPFSQLQCTVAKIVTGSTYASGTVNFPITFNVGESALQTDLEDSTCFTPGTNTVTFNDGPNKLSTTANFQAGSPMPDDFDPDTIVFRNRAAPSTNEYQHYLLAGNCPNGYRSGKLGFRFSGGTLDCSSVHAAITDQLNAWYFPETESDFSFTPRCTSNGFSISYNNIPAGFRPFIDGLIRQSSSSLTVSYTNSYVCSDFYRYRYNPIIDWGNYDNSGTGSNGNVVVVTTKTWTKSTTQLTTLPFNTAPGNTKTIEVNVPIPTVTTTTTWTGYQTTTTTVTATPGQTATVIVEIPTKRPPNPTTTKTTTWTGLQTSSLTLTNTPGGSDTVIVEVPSNAQTTTTSTWTGNFTTTITSTDHQGGTDTVIIEVP
ncbi:cell-wall agglutinin N-terminal ligand-sugar binding-domain-containing protein, partial [Scheffersomyces xylosifermentans]|uniref:cell-wall agglutinin N-terminal ligand-sugar binding-domain-containing protein n=1 Tax=Scheffersomyces xylosifermentans TaxID=1304137 RepID=UPI00315D9C93